MIILNDYVNIYLMMWECASNVLLSEKRQARKTEWPIFAKREKEIVYINRFAQKKGLKGTTLNVNSSYSKMVGLSVTFSYFCFSNLTFLCECIHTYIINNIIWINRSTVHLKLNTIL